MLFNTCVSFIAVASYSEHRNNTSYNELTFKGQEFETLLDVSFQKYYFHINPRAEDMEFGNITGRIELRKKLKCNSFQWFLENVYPEQLSVSLQQQKILVQIYFF